MNLVKIRNRGFLILLSIIGAGITYFVFEDMPEISISSNYIFINVAVIFLLFGSVAATRFHAGDYWYEIIAEFLVVYFFSCVAIFAIIGLNFENIILFLPIAILGAVLSEGIFRYVSPILVYRFIGLLLAISFSFVLIYTFANVFITGTFSLLPPILVFIGVYGAIAYGLNQEVADRTV